MRNLFFLLLSVLALSAKAQTFEVGSLVTKTEKITIKGKVIDGDSENQPLAFASVKIKELGIVAQTDLNGVFYFRLTPDNYTFLYTFIGYKSKEVKISENKLSELPKIILSSEALHTGLTTSNDKI